MAFHHQADQPLAFLGFLGEELFGRGGDGFGIAPYFDLRDRFHGDRHALLGVHILAGSHVEGHQLEGEFAAGFDHRENDGAAALDDAGSAEAVDDDGLVGPGPAEHLGHHHHEEQDGEDHERRDDPYSHNRLHTPSFRRVHWMSPKLVYFTISSKRLT